QEARKLGLSGVEHPFWEDFPTSDICRVICQDVLHGLHKAFKDHLLTWHTNILGESEIDKRFRRLVKTPGHHCFTGGISKISQWSMKVARDVESDILGVLSGAASRRALVATRAELDFIYTARYTSMSHSVAKQLHDYNRIYHDNKQVFIDEGGRTGKNGAAIPHFNIPKIHARHHYPDNILDVGTMDNCSAEITEHSHVDHIKKAYKATNRKQPVPQMLGYLNRTGGVAGFSPYICWRLNNW
ncbi:hypothetical protein AURDEDRAFT_23538, partial [Auricularia subglabra TFB-10046 SS5]